MSNFKNLLGCALVLALATAEARAALITPVSVTPSSEFAGAVNLINGSGLDVIGRHDNNENNMWQTFAGTSVGESVEFKLDGLYDLSDALIWQYNGPNGFGLPELDREVEDFELAISLGVGDPFVSLGTNTLRPALNQLSGPVPDANEPLQSFALAGENLARRVKLTILSVYSPPSDGFAGLSEVRFEGVRIPEPTTFALAALSIGSLLFGRRKR